MVEKNQMTISWYVKIIWNPGFNVKVLLEHKHAIHLHTIYGFFHYSVAELSSCYKDPVVHQDQIIYHLALDRKFANSYRSPALDFTAVTLLGASSNNILWLVILPSTSEL